jgi:hypothetical protein
MQDTLQMVDHDGDSDTPLVLSIVPVGVVSIDNIKWLSDGLDSNLTLKDTILTTYPFGTTFRVTRAPALVELNVVVVGTRTLPFTTLTDFDTNFAIIASGGALKLTGTGARLSLQGNFAFGDGSTSFAAVVMTTTGQTIIGDNALTIPAGNTFAYDTNKHYSFSATSGTIIVGDDANFNLANNLTLDVQNEIDLSLFNSSGDTQLATIKGAAKLVVLNSNSNSIQIQTLPTTGNMTLMNGINVLIPSTALSEYLVKVQASGATVQLPVSGTIWIIDTVNSNAGATYGKTVLPGNNNISDAKFWIKTASGNSYEIKITPMVTANSNSISATANITLQTVTGSTVPPLFVPPEEEGSSGP